MIHQAINQSVYGQNSLQRVDYNHPHHMTATQVADSKASRSPAFQEDIPTTPPPTQEQASDSSSAVDLEEQSSPSSRQSQSPTWKDSRLAYTWHQHLTNLITLALLVVVIVFVQATYDAERNSSHKRALSTLMKVDVSTTLAVLRVAQGLLSALTSIALVESLVSLQWSLIESPRGLRYLDLLALSPTSGAVGTLQLVVSSMAPWSARIRAFLRLFLLFLAWISGIALFFDTSFVTVYDTAFTYNATAGVGPFNHSLVEPFMNSLHNTAPGYPYDILPFTYYAAVYTLVLNPLVSSISQPVACKSQGCMAYLLSGGLEYVAPWAPRGNDQYGLVKVDRVPSLQLDFENANTSSEFLDSECEIFGEYGVQIGIRFCVAESQGPNELIRAGLFVCLDGTDGDSCRGHVERPNITTTLSAYTRTATIVSARSNYSIVDVHDVSAPIPLHTLDTNSYRMALNWLLNSSAAAIPAPSSVSQSFWSSDQQLKDPSTYGILLQNFQSIVAFPFWFFNDNNWGNIDLKSNEIISSLPPQFYTEASVITPFTKLRINPSMYALFLTIQVIVMLFNWGILVWLWFRPKIATAMSSWPLFDVSYKTRVEGDDESFIMESEALTTSGIMRAMKMARIHKKKVL